MSCPAWENCDKKGCIEQCGCTDPNFWSAYWKKMAGFKTGTRVANRARKKAAKDLYLKDRPACVKTGDWCDKKESCDILGQCIVTIARIASNKPLMEALKGPHSIGGIIKILRQYDPEPMESYYFCQKRKKI